MDEEETGDPFTIESGRRGFLLGSALAGTMPLVPAQARPASGKAASENMVGAKVSVLLDINETSYRREVDPRTTLLDMLREHLNLTGAKKGCDHGQCGACTVLIDGRRQLSCLTLAASVGRRKVTTIEGLASTGDELHPMQQAFIDHDAFQCGYCTPGQILSAIGCVREGHASTAEEIREYMSGNICRCAAYPNIVAAVTQARADMEG